MKLTLRESIVVYWPCLVGMALLPTLCVLASMIHPGLAVLVFIGLGIPLVTVHYRLGRAPKTFVVISCITYFFLGAPLAMVTWAILGMRG